jgi:hypothetical protein
MAKKAFEDKKISEDNKPKEDMDSGELVKFMQDLKSESMDMMDKLTQIDGILVRIKAQLESGKTISNKKLIDDIEDIRSRIGSLEREDEIELGEEEQADTLLEKLKKWVDQII